MSSIKKSHGSEEAGSLVTHLESLVHALKAADIVKLLGLSKTQVYRMSEEGRIPCFYIGTSLRFDPGVVAKWLKGKQGG
jgi:excisionase family DNA binding protein